MGEYCGAETALAFADPRAELAALLHNCGVYDLGGRAHFRISGKDRVRWLNGMVSNNMRELPVGRGNYNFVLTPQAHIQGDLYIYNLGEYFLAGTEQFQLEKLMSGLRRYIIMDQVELTDIGNELTAVGVQGPKALAVLGKAGFDGPLPQPMEIIAVNWRGRAEASDRSPAPGSHIWLTRMAEERFETYEIWLAPADVASIWDAVVAAGAMPIGTAALERFRVAAGIPRYGLDIRERDLPQETGQMQALNFSKGCYIGQEIVERIRARGNVHRNFTGFTIEGPPPALGAKVQANGKEVGEITSALAMTELDGSGSRTLALGYIRREVAKPGTAVEIDGARGIVSQLPFTEIFQSEFSNA
jgi:folate-binding protein YgfZ